jgi:hypothetical protein
MPIEQGHRNSWKNVLRLFVALYSHWACRRAFVRPANVTPLFVTCVEFWGQYVTRRKFQNGLISPNWNRSRLPQQRKSIDFAARSCANRCEFAHQVRRSRYSKPCFYINNAFYYKRSTQIHSLIQRLSIGAVLYRILRFLVKCCWCELRKLFRPFW